MSMKPSDLILLVATPAIVLDPLADLMNMIEDNMEDMMMMMMIFVYLFFVCLIRFLIFDYRFIYKGIHEPQ